MLSHQGETSQVGLDGPNMERSESKSPAVRQMSIRPLQGYRRTFAQRLTEECIHPSTKTQLLRGFLTVGAQSNN